MTDTADLEKRLRGAGAGVPKATRASGFFTVSTQAPIAALCVEAADALADLTKKLEEVRKAAEPVTRYAYRRHTYQGRDGVTGEVYFDENWLPEDSMNAIVKYGDLRRLARCLSPPQAPAVTGQGET